MTARNPFSAVFSHYSFDIARLEPSESSTDQIAVTLGEPTRTDTGYECVSYDRSKDYGNSKILLNGEETEIPVPLEAALRALRKPREPRFLWADVLLGRTQQQLNEQAAVAKQVLQNAKATIAWLGPGNNSTEEAFDVLKTLAIWWHQGAVRSNFPTNFARATAAQMTALMTYVRSQDPKELYPDNEKLWETMLAIMESEYFTSVQSIGDIVLSSDVIVTSGTSSMLWPDFMGAFRCLVTAMPQLLGKIPSEKLQAAFTVTSGIEIADRRYREEGLELLPMIQTAKEGRSADPREFVFSMLPIVRPSKRQKITGRSVAMPTADYSKTTEEVFTEAAKFVIDERQDLIIWWAERPPNGRRLKNMPSWVPDWTTPLGADPVKPETQSSPSLREWSDSVKDAKTIRITDNKLALQVHELDRISSVSRMFTQENCRRLLLEAWQALPPVPNQSLEDKVHSYWRTIVMNVGGQPETLRHQATPPKEMWVSFQSILAEERVLELLKCTPEQLMNDPELRTRAQTDPQCQILGPQCGKSEAFEALLRKNSIGRRFFTTEKGRTGMTAFEEAPVIEGETTEADAKVTAALNQFPTESDPFGFGGPIMDQFQQYLTRKDPTCATAFEKLMKRKAEARGAKVGDVIVAAVGGFTPYVLRPVVDESSSEDAAAHGNEFRYIGDCYLHGVMAGEPFSVKNWLGRHSWKTDITVKDVKIV